MEKQKQTKVEGPYKAGQDASLAMAMSLAYFALFWVYRSLIHLAISSRGQE